MIALVGDWPDQLALADRPHLLGTAGAIARAALDEYGRHDDAPRNDGDQQLIAHIAVAWMFPEMTGLVDDSLGLDKLVVLMLIVHLRSTVNASRKMALFMRTLGVESTEHPERFPLKAKIGA